jgi:hypothetical protein
VVDIFVSYTSSDKEWANWIGLELERLGHVAHVHGWEISAGGNIPAWMEERFQRADHVLFVISKLYLTKDYSNWERLSAEWAAVSEKPNFGLPVFVEECVTPTLLAPFKRCDLYGLNEEEARAKLAGYLTPASKPASVPFPRASPSSPTKRVVPFPGHESGLSNILVRVPTHFLGRDDALKAIDAALQGGEGRVAALHGLRGVGKSTLAAAYAKLRKAEYRATWWIQAATPETTRADLVALGVRLGWIAFDEKEEPALGKVRESLSGEGEGLLLVYDNAIDASSIRDFLPAIGAANVLITSNSPAGRGVATTVELPLWSKEVGADYLIARTGSKEHRAEAEALSEALAGLTLAHEQAGAYCERLGLSLADYRKRFTAAPEPLLDAAKDASPKYHGGLTVAKAFALAIDKAAEMHPAAESLIAYAALLAAEPIPLFLFSEARKTFDEPFQSQIAGDGLDEAVGALRAFALVDRETIRDERDPSITTESIRLHRLVRIAATRRQGEAAEAARRVLIKAMATVYPGTVFSDPGAWPRARRLDALALDLVGGAAPPKGEEASASSILDTLASYRQRSLAAFSEARSLFERALAMREKSVGPEDTNTAESLNNLALLLRLQGSIDAPPPPY